MLVTYTILTHNRSDDLREALLSILRQSYPEIEVIVVDNGSNDETTSVVHTTLRAANYKYIKLGENAGVSQGRNVAMQEASGDLLITIDDDALLIGEHSTRKVVRKFESDEKIGILAFKVIDDRTDQLETVSFPTRNKSRDPEETFETTWYIGVGHAIRKSLIDTIGVYRDFSPYGSEEFDYSLRSIDAGFKIVYFPAVVVRHKKSTQGRAPDKELLAVSLKNRLKAAALNLPWISVLSHMIVRSAQKIIQARGNFFVLILAYYWFLVDLPYVLKHRSKVGQEALKRLKELNGPLYY